MSASTIQVKTLLEALDRPSTLAALVRKTSYPAGRVHAVISQARAEGNVIIAAARGQRYEDQRPTTYVHLKGDS